MSSKHPPSRESEGKTILVDTCAGNLPRTGMNELFGRPWPPSESPLLTTLANEGVAALDIDIVLITHLHFDHIGGNSKKNGERYVPAFPNAQYLVGRIEYERCAGAATALDATTFDRALFDECIAPLDEAGALTLVDDGHAVDANISLGLAAGHTSGQMVVMVRSGDQAAVLCGDLVHFDFEVREPDICGHSDVDPVMAASTRRSILGECADTDALLLSAHLLEPVARIQRAGRGFSMEGTG